MFALLFGLAMVPRSVAAEPDWGTLPAELHPDTEALARASSRDDDEDDDDDDKPRKKKSEDEDDKKPVARKGKAAVGSDKKITDASKFLAREDRRWARVDQRAKVTYEVGGAMVVGGYLVQLGAAAIDDEALYFTGGIVNFIGQPVMMGAALRSQHALNEREVEVSGTPGYVAWGLWAGSLTSSVIAATKQQESRRVPYQLATVGMSLGSIVAVAVQAQYNANGRMEVDGKADRQSHADTAPTTLALTGFDVSPVEGGARLGLSGTF